MGAFILTPAAARARVHRLAPRPRVSSSSRHTRDTMLWHRQDLRDGVRTLRRQPPFTLAVVVTFALAIGTTTAIFAALDAVILTPLPFADPAALVVAWGQNPARAQPVREVSHAQFREWQARARGFSGLAAMSSANIPLTWTRATASGAKWCRRAVSPRVLRCARRAGCRSAAHSCPTRIGSTLRRRSSSATRSGRASTPAIPPSSAAPSPWRIARSPSSA